MTQVNVLRFNNFISPNFHALKVRIKNFSYLRFANSRLFFRWQVSPNSVFLSLRTKWTFLAKIQKSWSKSYSNYATGSGKVKLGCKSTLDQVRFCHRFWRTNKGRVFIIIIIIVIHFLIVSFASNGRCCLSRYLMSAQMIHCGFSVFVTAIFFTLCTVIERCYVDVNISIIVFYVPPKLFTFNNCKRLFNS